MSVVGTLMVLGLHTWRRRASGTELLGRTEVSIVPLGTSTSLLTDVI